MSDEFDERYTSEEEAPAPDSSALITRQSPLAWVLFLIALVAGGATSFVFFKRASDASERADQEAQARSADKATVEKSVKEKAEMAGKVAKLESQVTSLTQERDSLVAKVAALEATKNADKGTKTAAATTKKKKKK